MGGCRIIAKDTFDQDRIISLINKSFPTVSIVDRRVKPSFGYRAVHLIIKTNQKLIEVQVRTILQHNWAEFSEKLSDKIDPLIKYGGGETEIQDLLVGLSEHFAAYEALEIELNKASNNTDESQKPTVQKLKAKMEKLKIEMVAMTKAQF